MCLDAHYETKIGFFSGLRDKQADMLLTCIMKERYLRPELMDYQTRMLLKDLIELFNITDQKDIYALGKMLMATRGIDGSSNLTDEDRAKLVK